MTARKLVPAGTESSGIRWVRQAAASASGTVPWVPSPASRAATPALRSEVAKRRAAEASSAFHQTSPVRTASPGCR
ncbi:hypothetical protein GCM10009663_04770 [Kitasatospora arboriphila]|uniref:Uncharacterized protein n=1 Tax=Kitasatospora arboriphila TaxID=258052 RepID=A0ABN1TA82_9ACTN